MALNLESRGIAPARPSKSGIRKSGHWTRERVNQIVRSRTYLGEWVADKRKKLSVKVPQLVPDELYQLTDQRLLQAGKRGMARARNFHLAQGIARCGICGGLICCSGTYSRKHKKRLYYYICTNRRRPKADRCTLPMLRIDVIDAQLWAAVLDMLQRPDLIEKGLAAQGQNSNASALNWEKDLHDFRKKLARLNQADRVILDRFSTSSPTT